MKIAFGVVIGLVSLLPQAMGKELKKVSLRPQWAPQAQFAGYYYAKAKGFYEKVGLDVDIRPGGPGINPLVNVRGGKDTFSTELLTSAMTFASTGAPIVNIGQIFQTTALMLLSHKDQGIDSPKKMAGKKVGVWPAFFQIPALVLLKKFGVQAQLVRQGFTMDDFINRKLDVASAMVYNEYHMVLAQGVKSDDLNIIQFKDYGLNFPDDGIYVSQKTLDEDPKMCEAFVKASIMGWIKAFEEPEEALKVIMAEAEKVKTGTTLQHQRSMLEEVKKIVLHNYGIDEMGKLDLETFNFVQEVLQDQKLAKKEVEFGEFYKPLYKNFKRSEFESVAH